MKSATILKTDLPLILEVFEEKYKILCEKTPEEPNIQEAEFYKGACRRIMHELNNQTLTYKSNLAYLILQMLDEHMQKHHDNGQAFTELRRRIAAQLRD